MTSSISKLFFAAFLVFGSVACEREPCDESGGPVVRLDQGLGTCNARPIARGSARIDGKTIILSGTESSDANGEELSFTWTLVQAPSGSLAAIADPSAKVTSLETSLYGSYLFKLVVSDGELESVADDVSIGLKNRPPVANAGDDIDRDDINVLIALSGSGTDPDDDPLTYMWTLVDRPTTSTAALNDPTSPTPSFIPDIVGVYDFDLRVSDGELTSEPDRVRVRAGDLGSPPIADAGMDLVGTIGTRSVFDGRGSRDPDGDPLTYAWRFTESAVSTATLSNALSSRPYFTPTLNGRYVVEVTVSDGIYSSVDTATLEVPINPIGPAIFNPGEVYMYGTLSEGAAYLDAIAHWSNPNLESIGFTMAAEGHAIIRPTDGRVLYEEYVTDAPYNLYVFYPDEYGEPNFPDGPPTYPDNPTSNDTLLGQAACPGRPRLNVRPNGDYVYQCGTGIFDSSGTLITLVDMYEELLSITDNNTMLFVRDTSSPYLTNVRTGTVATFVEQLIYNENRGRARIAPDQQSFYVPMGLSGTETTALVQVFVTGTSTVVGLYGDAPVFQQRSGALDASLDLYTLDYQPPHDVVVRQSLTRPTEVIYTEATEPKVYLHGSSLFTGP